MKREAAFEASLDAVHGICHCTGVKGVEMRCCLLFSGRIFNLTNLLNHVVLRIELMVQM